jgi:hypothetical protein
MDKPRIFLGSSEKQGKLLEALPRGLEDIAHVEPWTTSFNPGTTTLERLLELAREVDFAAFARDDWTTHGTVSSSPSELGCTRDHERRCALATELWADSGSRSRHAAVQGPAESHRGQERRDDNHQHES